MSNVPEMPWLESEGPQPAMVLSTRVRLARNLASHRYRDTNRLEDRLEIIDLIEGARAGVGPLKGAGWHKLDQLTVMGRRWLSERQLVPKELAERESVRQRQSGGAVLAGYAEAVVCNEEDHLRIQAMAPGFQLQTAHISAAEIATRLGEKLCFAFHPEFGYLTACPTNVGTGLRASVLIHLPALVITKEIGKVLRGLDQVGLTHRGFGGEGSAIVGDLFQISNQATLGKTEAELLSHLDRLLVEVVGHEEKARAALFKGARTMVEDRAWRALALLQSARMMNLEEAIRLFGDLRLGVGMAIVPRVRWTTLNRLLVEVQDAHLARSAETSLDDEALPVYRADTIRRMLAEEEVR